MISDSIKCTNIRSLGANYNNWQWLSPRELPLLCCGISLSCELSQRLSISQRLRCLQRSEEPVTLSPILDFLQLESNTRFQQQSGKKWKVT